MLSEGNTLKQAAVSVASQQLSDRGEIEQTLRRAYAYNRSLIEASLDPLVTIDPEGKITDVNTATELVTGYSRKELIGTEFADYFTEPDEARTGYREVFEKGIVRDYPLQIRHRDGHITTVLYNASVYRDDTGRVIGVFAAARDVTERMKAESELNGYRDRLEEMVEERTKELQEANRRLQREISERKKVESELRSNEGLLRTVLETLPIGIWIIDSKGQIIHGNPAGRHIWEGARYVELDGFGEYKGWRFDTQEMIKPEEWAGARAIRKGETTLNEEIEIECFDGKHKIILNSAVPIRDPSTREITGAVVINQDITERKVREMEHARLIAALEQITEGIIITDKDWSIQYVNPAIEQMSGYTRGELIGREPRLLWSPKQDGTSFEETGQTVMDARVWKGNITSRKKDGSQFDAEVTVSPVRNRVGRITNVAIVKRDVTRELEFEKRLYQSQKMEAIGALAGGIAHDFNNILGVIFGFTQLALREAPAGSQIKNCLEDIFKAGHRAKDLVAQILAFSHQGEQKRVPVQIGQVIRETEKFLRASLPSTIEICTDIALPAETGSATVLADRTRIHQVVMNLCTNAAQAMRERGGVLRMSVSLVDVDAEGSLCYADLKPGLYVRLSVSDTGCGIAPAVLDRIFEPYFSTRESGEGTGLGLAVVHGIVKSYGGALSVESAEGKGATFHILLPRTEIGVLSEPNVIQPIIGGTERILFVDDEQAMVRMWGKLLAPLGYKVVCKTSSLEALDIFRSQADEFDLVITDQTMPHLTGAELSTHLLSIKPGIPIILCTGFSESITLEGAKALGIRKFLMKPLELRSLTQAVRSALEGSSEQ